jgi:pimeloyl-ACP methyl ester carboxylesterase
MPVGPASAVAATRPSAGRATSATLIHFGEAEKGGHFAALEQPEILVSEIRTGLRSLRS